MLRDWYMISRMEFAQISNIWDHKVLSAFSPVKGCLCIAETIRVDYLNCLITGSKGSKDIKLYPNRRYA